MLVLQTTQKRNQTMKTQTQSPLLLTLIERRYLNHHYEDERTSGDVYKALYL